MSRLTQDQIVKNLTDLAGWSQEENHIAKIFELKDFAEALAFVNKIGAEAEKMDHHPDIFIHSWNKVMITLSTHSEGGLTEKDFQLAEKIERLK